MTMSLSCSSNVGGGVGMGWGLINSLECALNHAQHTQPCINCPSCGLEGLLNYCSHLSPNESLTPSPSILQMSVLFQFLVGDILFLEKRTLNSYFAFAAWAMKSFQFIQCGPFLLRSLLHNRSSRCCWRLLSLRGSLLPFIQLAKL